MCTQLPAMSNVLELQLVPPAMDRLIPVKHPALSMDNKHCDLDDLAGFPDLGLTCVYAGYQPIAAYICYSNALIVRKSVGLKLEVTELTRY